MFVMWSYPSEWLEHSRCLYSQTAVDKIIQGNVGTPGQKHVLLCC